MLWLEQISDSGFLYLECACFVLWYQLRVTFSWFVSLSLKETVVPLCFFLPSKHPVVLTTMLTPVFSALARFGQVFFYAWLIGHCFQPSEHSSAQ